MKITKLGHCCLIVEEQGIRILTDPGAWTVAQNSVRDIDVVLITHEHPDHLHIDSVKNILQNNPDVKIYTNSAVGKILEKEPIAFELLEHGQTKTVNGVLLEAYGKLHAPIYPGIEQVQNTGFFVAQRFFYPGDAFFAPEKPVEILALPVAGPWLKMSEVIDYAKEIRPKIAFPVHDGMLKIIGPFHILPKMMLGKIGINFRVLEPDQASEF